MHPRVSWLAFVVFGFDGDFWILLVICVSLGWIDCGLVVNIVPSRALATKTPSLFGYACSKCVDALAAFI